MKGQECTSKANAGTHTEVFDPNFKFLYEVPSHLVVHMPPARLNITRLVICRNYKPNEPSSCAMWANCRFVHADVDFRTLEAQPVHVNYIWRHEDLCTYNRLLPGDTIEVLSPGGAQQTEVIPSERILVTRGAIQRNESNARPLSHCVHYYCNRMCNRGEQCNFIHAVYVDPNVRGEFKRAPVQAMPRFTASNINSANTSPETGALPPTQFTPSSPHFTSSMPPKRMGPHSTPQAARAVDGISNFEAGGFQEAGHMRRSNSFDMSGGKGSSMRAMKKEGSGAYVPHTAHNGASVAGCGLFIPTQPFANEMLHRPASMQQQQQRQPHQYQYEHFYPNQYYGNSQKPAAHPQRMPQNGGYPQRIGNSGDSNCLNNNQGGSLSADIRTQQQAYSGMNSSVNSVGDNKCASFNSPSTATLNTSVSVLTRSLVDTSSSAVNSCTPISLTPCEAGSPSIAWEAPHHRGRMYRHNPYSPII